VRRIRLTLHWRIAATVAIAVLASTVVVTYAAYRLERNGTRDRFVAAALAGARADLGQAAGAVARTGGAAPAQAVAKFVVQRGGIDWLVYDRDNPADQLSSGVPTFDDLPPVLIDGPALVPTWVRITGRHLLAVAGDVAGGVRLVEFYDFDPVRAQLARLRSDLIRLDAVGLLVAVLLGLGVATRISRPVRRAARAAQRLGAGALQTRIPVRGNDELAELARSFNDMAARLSATMAALHESQAQQRRFVADVSHELRTPLAALLAAGEELSNPAPAARARAGELVAGQTRRLTRMVEDLLEISRFDAGQARLEIEWLDVAALARDVVSTVAADQDVAVAGYGATTVSADPRRLHAVLRNLVTNAVQHGAPPVRVDVDGRGQWLVVTVSDSGPGVDPDLAAVIFDRFVRADSARSSSSGSTGLGLAIARENALLHGGTLTVSTGAHAAFVLTLPRAPVAAEGYARGGPRPESRATS
jgi:two-component system sensor histidine kinase MtrB